MKLRKTNESVPSYPNCALMRGLIIGSSITAALLFTGCASEKDEGGRSDAKKIETKSLPAATAAHKTAADTDGDGIPDATDKCPKVKGTEKAQGCPEKKPQPVRLLGEIAPVNPVTPGKSASPPADSDGDGVPDNIDRCPKVKGPKSNNGCPPLPGGPRRIQPPPVLPKPGK